MTVPLRVQRSSGARPHAGDITRSAAGSAAGESPAADLSIEICAAASSQPRQGAGTVASEDA